MRIAIVDDHALVRKGLAALLAQETDMEVVGEAATIQETVEMIECKRPEVILLNIHREKDIRLDFLTRFEHKRNDLRVIMLTPLLEEHELKSLLQLGVSGYILKQALPEELIYAIRVVFKGRKYYDPLIMDSMIQGDSSPDKELTPREMQVLMSLGQGLNNFSIAKRLFVTEFTVKKHIGQILSKLNLKDRTSAALYANVKGLVEYKDNTTDQ